MSLWRPKGQARQVAPPPSGLMASHPWIPVTRQGFADVDASQVDTALQSVAVAAAMDLIASLGSELPLQVFRGRGAERQSLPVPGYLEDPAGDGYGREDWCYRVLVSWLARGNLFGEVLDRRAGHPTQVELFHPDRVTGHVEDGEPVWFVAGRRVSGEFLHRRVFPMPGQILGRSPIAYHASTLGVSLASTQFGLQWFQDGAHPTTVMKSTERTVDEKLSKQVKEKFLAALRGTREPLVIDKGWETTQIQIAPEESQFLETQGFSAAECARIFGPGIAEILGYETGGTMTYSNIQERDLHLLKYSLNKWLRRLERLLSQFLPRPQYVRLDRDALLETSTLQRYQAHASALQNRWKVVNEVRRTEDLSPVAWGDEPNGTDGGSADEGEEQT